MTYGFYIAISGMMGSGKSTIARSLASHLGWKLLPEDLRSRMYLNDLFEDEERWAFDTQVSFLCKKSIRLKKYLESKNNLILDRSIYEDVEVFAEYFYSKGKIDKRSYQTYLELAKYFIEELPKPEFIIYCNCQQNTIIERINRRDRKYQKLYPENHLENIYNRYAEWIRRYDFSSVYLVDTDVVDFRNIDTSLKVAEDIKYILSSPTGKFIQKTLPGLSDFDENKNCLTFLKEKVPYTKQKIKVKIFKKKNIQRYSYPVVYIAAPFTARAETKKNTKDKNYSLFEFDKPHGTIKKGVYRETLNSISRYFKHLGFSVILPHRDINEWGVKTLTPEQVFSLCTKDLYACDLFVGILGLSHGSHYEFGLMHGLNRPSILIYVKEIEESFISQGIKTDRKNILVLKCGKLQEVKKVLRSIEIIKFLKTYFPMEELK